jgi:hypothetical protein
MLINLGDTPQDSIYLHGIKVQKVKVTLYLIKLLTMKMYGGVEV